MKKIKLIDALNLLGDNVKVEILGADGSNVTPIFVNRDMDKLDKALLKAKIEEINPLGLNSALIVLA